MDNLDLITIHGKAAYTNKEYLLNYFNECYGPNDAAIMFKYYEQLIEEAIKGNSFSLEFDFPNGANVPYASVVMYYFSIWLWNEYWGSVAASNEMSAYETQIENDSSGYDSDNE